LPWIASDQAVRRKPSYSGPRSGSVRDGRVAEPEMAVRPASVMVWMPPTVASEHDEPTTPMTVGSLASASAA
jgi:hypothetical protein